MHCTLYFTILYGVWTRTTVVLRVHNHSMYDADQRPVSYERSNKQTTKFSCGIKRSIDKLSSERERERGKQIFNVSDNPIWISII